MACLPGWLLLRVDLPTWVVDSYGMFTGDQPAGWSLANLPRIIECLEKSP